MTWVADALLIGGMLVLGWRVVAAPGLFRSVVLFLAFGVVMALVWLRLGAPDVALAEAAVGVGVTGTLLLVAYRDLALRAALMEPGVRGPLRAVLAAAASAVTLLVAFAAADVQDAPRPLSNAVATALPESGVDSGVTAVLLNFRGYDTLLELAVLLAAVVAVATLRPGFPVALPDPAGDPRLDAVLARVVVPPAVVVGGYLFWAGTSRPGGAFQGGAVLAAALVLVALTHRIAPHGHAPVGQRVATLAGACVFLAVALATIPVTGGLLDYPVGAARGLIVLIEAGITVSVALSLALLCTGAAGLGPGRAP